MSNFTNIPFLNPIKFVPSTTTPGKNFDDDWAYNQIKEWEMRVCYHQKWQFGDETPLQIISTVLPDKLKLYNRLGAIVKDFEWIPVASSGTTAGTVYETTVNIDDDGGGSPVALPAGIYWLYQEVTTGSYQAKFISEPIELRVTHKNTSVIKYTNSENAQGVYFGVTDIVFLKRMECQLCEFLPDSDQSQYIDQIRNAQNLTGQPFRTWKLLFANAPGITDYEIDLSNRILTLDSVRYNDKLITKVSGAKWEVNRTKGYPMAGWGIEVTETINLTGLQYNDLDQVIPGVVTAYDIDEDLYGTTDNNDIHILDTEQI